MNDEFRDLLSRPTASVPKVGKVCFGLARNAAYAAALRGETLLAADFTFTAGSPAETVKVRSSARPLRAADGRIRGAILVFTEID